MRNAGNRVPRGPSGRRRRGTPPPEASSRPGENGGRSLFTPAYRVSPAGGSRAEYPWAETGQASAGYRTTSADRPADEGGWSDHGLPGTGYSWADEAESGEIWAGTSPPLSNDPSWPATASNAIRGFPPAPGDPLPPYPPGPFAAWNSTGGGRPGRNELSDPARTADPARQRAAATITPDDFDTDFSLPAIKDPVRRTALATRSPLGARREITGPDRPSGGRPDSAGKTQPRGSATTATKPKAAEAKKTQPAGRGHRALAAAGSGARRRARAAGGRTRPTRQSVWLAIGAAAVIIVAVAAVLVLPSLRHPAASNTPPKNPKHSSSTSPSPKASSPSRPAGKWAYIGARATDTVPLTLAELYPAGFTSSGAFYRRTASAAGKNCRGALIGSTLQTAVHDAGCTQAVRATFVSRAAKVMGTIGVFNLKTATSASKAALAAGNSEFVAQLPGKRGPSRQIGQGTGVEEAIVKGHYLVLVWAEFTDLSAPQTTAQRQKLATFISLLINQTANNSLSARMVNGTPSPTPTA